MISAFSTWTEF